jgi:hypothetical protein
MLPSAESFAAWVLIVIVTAAAAAAEPLAVVCLGLSLRLLQDCWLCGVRAVLQPEVLLP